MATANGTRTPPDHMHDATDGKTASTNSTDKKRKREDDLEPEHASRPTTSRNAQSQRDVLEILERHDTNPSFLQHAVEHKEADIERSLKKVRLSNSAIQPTTLASKLSSAAYTSLKDLKQDAEHVSESLIAGVRAKAEEREGQNGRLLVDDLKQMQRIQAFEQIVSDVVEQESRYDSIHSGQAMGSKKVSGEIASNRVADTQAGAGNRTGTVLTLFGNAPTPKQLFSSMQNARRGESGMHSELPIEEMSLPNGLSATKIMSTPADVSAKAPTFEENFPPAYNLPALHPPRSHRRSATRDETIKWEFKNPLATRSKKGGYTVQSLSVGEWLGYGGVDSQDEPSSPREKRKMRDRVLSSGESSLPPPNKTSLEEQLAKEEEALFRRAYSSFAPSCDNSKALVSEETKSMMWWHKVGHRKYQETFAIDPALLDEPIAPPPDAIPPAEEIDFSKVIEDLDEFEETPDAEPTVDKTNVEVVLREISNLLETLASHQRIRNASLHSSASAVRTPISPAPALTSRIGRPDSPAEDEVSTYQALRRELAYLILKLPPYAVAKLDGNQLADLGVSELIMLEGKNMKGTMEEDQVARLAKYTAAATAHGIATLTRTGSGSQHYSSTSQRTPAIGQAANTRYGQSSQYSGGRTPVAQPQYNRSTSNQQTYGTPSATAPRPGYGQPNQYSRPGAQQQGYGQSNSQQYYQRPLSQNTSNYYGTPQQNQHQRPSYPSSQPLAQFQQRSHSAAQNAIAYQQNNHQQQGSPYNRTASPLKPANHQVPLQPSPVPRGGQQFQPPPASDRATPVGYPSQPGTPVNGIAPQQPRPVAPKMGTPQPSSTQQGQGQSVQANGHA